MVNVVNDNETAGVANKYATTLITTMPDTMDTLPTFSRTDTNQDRIS